MDTKNNSLTEEHEMLLRAANEIQRLRGENALMAAKLDVFDKCMLLIHTSPNYGNMGMQEDLAWKIEKYLDEQKSKLAQG